MTALQSDSLETHRLSFHLDSIINDAFPLLLAFEDGIENYPSLMPWVQRSAQLFANLFDDFCAIGEHMQGEFLRPRCIQVVKQRLGTNKFGRTLKNFGRTWKDFGRTLKDFGRTLGRILDALDLSASNASKVRPVLAEIAIPKHSNDEGEARLV
ncbi:hypothetical protein K435DRAFT_804844 [Dendrothele bispora CBS 962.96]|uniref:Uncharacterized protein n=1 Tax=Dendrothele bispora (strain CBS 962.96) TaxID=1314807 RepID=A0A4S8LEB8_DENBC|nr:hypothetical protein K435DRAFT_804844 [Dendrothele bispora CBS 962.96]